MIDLYPVCNHSREERERELRQIRRQIKRERDTLKYISLFIALIAIFIACGVIEGTEIPPTWTYICIILNTIYVWIFCTIIKDI